VPDSHSQSRWKQECTPWPGPAGGRTLTHVKNPQPTTALPRVTVSTTLSALSTPGANLCDDDIRNYAFHLYQQSGCIPGHDLDNWLEATACLKANIPERRSHSRLHLHTHAEHAGRALV